MADPVNNFGMFATDPANDPYGPNGIETRKGRRDSRPMTWPARSREPESPVNALIEYSRARQERGDPIGRDVQIPPTGNAHMADPVTALAQAAPQPRLTAPGMPDYNKLLADKHAIMQGEQAPSAPMRALVALLAGASRLTR